MKKNITYVDAALIEAMLRARGVSLLAQAGFVRLDFAEGRRLYVASTKRVGRVDISGVSHEELAGVPGVNLLGADEAFGNVKAQLDFNSELTPETILANLENLVTFMTGLPAVEKATRAKSTSTKPVAQGWSSDIPKAPSGDELKAARLEKLKASGKKKNKKADSAAASSETEQSAS